MLPSENRLRRSADFATVLKGGARARRGHLVVHLATDLTEDAPLVGLVVGKSVGGSVVRHRISRRLRHQTGRLLNRVPKGGAVVIRALPGAELDSSATFAADLESALRRLVGV